MRTLVALAAVVLTLSGQAGSQTPKGKVPPPPAPMPPTPKATPKATPKLEPVAETKLVMVGLTNANFKGLERLLRDPPKDDQAWIYARGQALLIAETGNLLMIRPPHNPGENTWFDRAMELRSKAAQLGRMLAQKDYSAGRAEFVNLANVCNRCHQSFRIPVQIEPFAEPANQH
jgi:hypothetical protein